MTLKQSGCTTTATRRVAVAALSLAIASSCAGPGKFRVEVEEPATAMDWGADRANNSPLLMADPTDRRFVVLAHRLDAPDFNCALEVSGDGGRSWSSARPLPQLPTGAEKCYAPEVAFDREGTLYYLFVGLEGRGNQPMGAFLTTSRDRARSFSPPHQVLGPLNFAVRMAIDATHGDRGRLHLVWLHATSDPGLGSFGPPPNPVQASYSDDGGRSFSVPVQVSDPHRQRVVAPALALGPDHGVHVAYYDLEDDRVDYHGLEGPVWAGKWSLVMASSRDAGLHFGGGLVVDDAIGPPERVMLIFTMAPPALAVHGDRLCLAWSDARHGDPDVVLRCSYDGGQRWGTLRRVNDEPMGNGARQYMPALAFAPNGRLDTVFYDRRHDPADVSNHVFFSSSNDGGRSFDPHVKVTARPSDSRIGARYRGAAAQGLVEFGSRIALLPRSEEALAAWTDTRHSKPARRAQDIYTVGLVLGGDGGAMSVPAPAWAVLAGLVVAMAVLFRRRGRRRASDEAADATG